MKVDAWLTSAIRREAQPNPGFSLQKFALTNSSTWDLSPSFLTNTRRARDVRPLGRAPNAVPPDRINPALQQVTIHSLQARLTAAESEEHTTPAQASSAQSSSCPHLSTSITHGNAPPLHMESMWQPAQCFSAAGSSAAGLGATERTPARVGSEFVSPCVGVDGNATDGAGGSSPEQVSCT